MTKHLELILKAALDAGTEILKVYTREDFNVTQKSDASPLTDADLNSHKVIMEALNETGIPVLSEEGADIPFEERKNWRRLWIVDPLDGTKEFVKRGGDFTVNIALVEDNYTVMGVVFAPWLGHLYWGSPEGSFFFDTGRNPVGMDVAKILTDGDKLPYKLPDKFTVVASKSHFSEETKQFIDKVKSKVGEVEFSSIGSSLKMCLVASGKAHLYPRLGPTMEWDTAAGQAVVENAGGKLIDLETGERMRYNREKLLNNYFLVSAGGVDTAGFI
ncbi:MAG: 3'(2'),5'-bisphosphate nucleotidase CysQ [Chlorobi bacterium]|nr:3'(2'),5'-bisphosphate nucleotidase CysQ [Chlorobiota bacterium]